jgi:hypothetical protein
MTPARCRISARTAPQDRATGHGGHPRQPSVRAAVARGSETRGTRTWGPSPRNHMAPGAKRTNRSRRGGSPGRRGLVRLAPGLAGPEPGRQRAHRRLVVRHPMQVQQVRRGRGEQRPGAPERRVGRERRLQFLHPAPHPARRRLPLVQLPRAPPRTIQSHQRTRRVRPHVLPHRERPAEPHIVGPRAPRPTLVLHRAGRRVPPSRRGHRRPAAYRSATQVGESMGVSTSRRVARGALPGGFSGRAPDRRKTAEQGGKPRSAKRRATWKVGA